jgi:hypothetical protein
MQNQRDPTKLNTDGNWKEKGRKKQRRGKKKEWKVDKGKGRTMGRGVNRQKQEEKKR